MYTPVGHPFNFHEEGLPFLIIVTINHNAGGLNFLGLLSGLFFVL
jgi:hypothetical protein